LVVVGTDLVAEAVDAVVAVVAVEIGMVVFPVIEMEVAEIETQVVGAVEGEAGPTMNGMVDIVNLKQRVVTAMALEEVMTSTVRNSGPNPVDVVNLSRANVP
jgi:hypothetical protein